MLQSGHQMDSEAYKLAENHALITHDYGLTPVKPVLDGEPIYEDTPDAIWMEHNVDKPRAVRRQCEGRPTGPCLPALAATATATTTSTGSSCRPHPVSCRNCRRDRGIGSPGKPPWMRLAGRSWFTCALIESRPFLTQVPDLSLLGSPPGTGNDRMGVLRGDGFALFYTPLGRSFYVRLDQLGWHDATLTWFDPRSGQHAAVGTVATTGCMSSIRQTNQQTATTGCSSWNAAASLGVSGASDQTKSFRS